MAGREIVRPEAGPELEKCREVLTAAARAAKVGRRAEEDQGIEAHARSGTRTEVGAVNTTPNSSNNCLREQSMLHLEFKNVPR
jgi:hypothetical protein